MIERYTTMGDKIFDSETQSFMDLEEACKKLNEYENNMGSIAGFIGDFSRRLDEVNKG